MSPHTCSASGNPGRNSLPQLHSLLARNYTVERSCFLRELELSQNSVHSSHDGVFSSAAVALGCEGCLSWGLRGIIPRASSPGTTGPSAQHSSAERRSVARYGEARGRRRVGTEAERRTDRSCQRPTQTVDIPPGLCLTEPRPPEAPEGRVSDGLFGGARANAALPRQTWICGERVGDSL